jgi:hypothetical protein
MLWKQQGDKRFLSRLGVVSRLERASGAPSSVNSAWRLQELQHVGWQVESHYSPDLTDFTLAGRIARFTAGALALFPYARCPTMPFPSCTVTV